MNRLLATFGSVEANSLVPVRPLIEPLIDCELEVLKILQLEGYYIVKYSIGYDSGTLFQIPLAHSKSDRTHQ